MLSVLKKSTYRHFIGKALFVIGVIGVAAAWNVRGPVPGWIIAAFFVFSLLAARFVARSKRQKYLCGAVALGAIVAGQAFFPLDFVILRHIIFNAPFLSAYLFPNIWPGIIISLVFAGLLTQAAINAGVPFASFWEILVGVTLLPLLLHSLAHVLCRLFEERRELRFANQELQNEISEKNKIEPQHNPAAAELSRKNSELTAALHNLEQAQKQVILQDKMASIGHLAAGITHEISNPLIFVTTNVETLGRYFAVLGEVLAGYRDLHTKLAALGEHPLKEEIGQMAKNDRDKAVDHILADLPVLFEDTLQGLQRLNAIVKGVRHFAHVDRQNAFRRYNLNEGLENALLVAHNQIKQHAEIELDLGPLPPFEAVRSEIDQVLLNLIINAVQAIGAKHTAGRGLIKISTWCAAAAVYCAIEDNGVGIPSHSLGNIFDPFYTTKPVGQGTGLGLSISYDIIVNRHQGEITVDSVEGQGAKFTIKLPIKHEWA